MAKVSTSISIDADVKAQAQALFADFGLVHRNQYLSAAVDPRELHPVYYPARGSQCGHRGCNEGSGGDGKEPVRL